MFLPLSHRDVQWAGMEIQTMILFPTFRPSPATKMVHFYFKEKMCLVHQMWSTEQNLSITTLNQKLTTVLNWSPMTPFLQRKWQCDNILKVKRKFQFTVECNRTTEIGLCIQSYENNWFCGRHQGLRPTYCFTGTAKWQIFCVHLAPGGCKAN